MKQFLTIITLTLTLNCFGQYQFDKTKISRQTEQVVAKIEKVNGLMGSAVYYAGIRPKQFDNFAELQKKATIAELTELTNHPNGVVRCYAFWGLSYDTTVNLLPIVVKHIDDDAWVNTQFGCTGDKEKVGDFFINIVTPQYIDLDSKKLTPAEFEYLDSILIYNQNNLYAKDDAIKRAKLSEALYARIRELALKRNNQTALVTLAKYRKEQDIPLILNNKMKGERYDKLLYTYRAISEFPHPAFLPLLRKSVYEAIEKTASSTEWTELYKAIASFKNEEALQLLKVPFTQVKNENVREYHINFIFGAVQEFYAAVFEELLWEMWEKDKKINTKVFNLLYPKNTEKALELTKMTLQNADDFYYLSTVTFNSVGDEDISGNLMSLMLDIMLTNDKPFALKAINKNIRECDVHQFPIFADKALKIKDTSFVESLFYRLDKEDNPHIYLKATEVLIAFNDKGINIRIVEVYKRNPGLRKDWGGKALSELLEKNGIQ